MAFEQYHIEDLDKQTTSLIKRTTTVVDFTQKLLFAFAEALESGKGLEQFNRFILALSDSKEDPKTGKKVILLTSTARQVGTYMQAFLPIKWASDHFAAEEVEGFDWEVARTNMEKVRWDKFKQMKADDAFNAESVWKSAMGKLRQIIANADKLPDDMKHYARQAEAVLKSQGEKITAK